MTEQCSDATPYSINVITQRTSRIE